MKLEEHHHQGMDAHDLQAKEFELQPVSNREPLRTLVSFQSPLQWQTC